MDLVKEIKERLSIFKNLYDVIRIVDPIDKENIVIKDDKFKKLKGTCYAHWKKNSSCPNCISMRSYLNNDTFVKIEYDEKKIILVTATPVEVEGKIYIVEILKDITHNGSVLHKLNENSYQVEELISEINEKAIRDELTGVYNRRYISERLPTDVNYSLRSKKPLSIIMADIDFFKVVNDKYGHTIGDKVLADFTNLILKSIRNTTDWVGRYGGEEFIIVLNNTDSNSAFIVAEKIRKILEKTTFQYGEVSIKITSSFGVYSLKDAKVDIEHLITKVDKNLYEAKISGRNKTVAS